MDTIKVENETLVRDTRTGAILETDLSKLQRHRARMAAVKSKDDAIESLTERINKLEELIERITNDSNINL